LQAWDAGSLSQNGIPFWDNPSGDGSQMGIGYFMTGTGGFAGHADSPGQPIAYFGLSVVGLGGAPHDYWFHASTTNGFDGALLVEFAGFSGVNAFGWYQQGNRNARTVLFSGADGAGAAVPFNPTPDFGFFLQSGEGNLYFTESSLNGTPAGVDANLAGQHFAAFGDGQSVYWIGVEDHRWPSETSVVEMDELNENRTGDFNDMVIRFSEATETPEPTTYALLSAGLLAIAWANFRRRTNQSLPKQPQRH
jgi:hypothetical protein